MKQNLFNKVNKKLNQLSGFSHAIRWWWGNVLSKWCNQVFFSLLRQYDTGGALAI